MLLRRRGRRNLIWKEVLSSLPNLLVPILGIQAVRMCIKLPRYKQFLFFLYVFHRYDGSHYYPLLHTREGRHHQLQKVPKRLECLLSQGSRDSVTYQVRLDTTVKQLIQEQDSPAPNYFWTATLTIIYHGRRCDNSASRFEAKDQSCNI